jgi:hypothetical protein
MKALGVASRHLQQTGDGILAHLDQMGRGPDTAAFVQMLDDRDRLGLRHLGVEQGRPATLRELLLALAAAQEPEASPPVHLADHQVAGHGLAELLAFGVHTR